MSFILDALKKSESDRQRQGGPALFEVKIAPPRHALPPWAVAIAVLLVANLGVVAWFMLRHAAAPGAAGEAAAPARAPAHAAAEAAPQASPPPPAGALAVVATPAAAPAARTVMSATTPAPAAVPAPAPAATRSAAAEGTAEAAPNPDDFAPAAEPPPSGALGRVKRATDAGVPLYQQLIATPGTQLPQLRLDLHAYAEHPGDRWVLINMHKLREGESLEGVHVDHITPDGAVLSYQGSQFLLTRE